MHQKELHCSLKIALTLLKSCLKRLIGTFANRSYFSAYWTVKQANLSASPLFNFEGIYFSKKKLKTSKSKQGC